MRVMHVLRVLRLLDFMRSMRTLCAIREMRLIRILRVMRVARARALGPFKSVPQVSLGRISCPSVSLKILKCPSVSLNFSEVSLTPRDTFDSTVSLGFSWCPSKILSVPLVSFKCLECPSSLGTLLISYCSTKDDDLHQCSPKYQCPLTGVTLLITQSLLKDVLVVVPRYPQISKCPLGA